MRSKRRQFKFNMDFDITKVTIDGNVDDLSEDQLRELVSKFQDANNSNIAEFEDAAESLDGVDENTIEDFEKARGDLIEDITEAEAFGEVPLTEDKLKDEDFSDLQDWKAFVTDQDEDDSEDGNFDDMGQRTQTDDEDVADFAEDEIGSMQGVNL